MEQKSNRQCLHSPVGYKSFHMSVLQTPEKFTQHKTKTKGNMAKKTKKETNFASKNRKTHEKNSSKPNCVTQTL